MSEHTETGSQAIGRSIRVLAFGDTADEIELAALDKARAFFGADARLEVVRDYQVFDVRSGALASAANGKQWQATVTVREPGR